jgi:RHS repeat-associated protein
MNSPLSFQVAGQRLNMGGASAFIDHADAVGSTTMETDPSGAVVWDVTHYPWGQVLAQGGTRQSVVWAGLDWQVNDPAIPSASREYNFRDYRWMTPDPGGVKVVKLDNPQTWNMYAYVGNNPTSRNDPGGLCIEDACVVETAVGLGLYTLTVATEEYLRSPAGQQATQNLGKLLIHTGQAIESKTQAGISLAKQGMGESQPAGGKAASDKSAESYADTTENRERMAVGKAPIGKDGYPVELHHPEQKPEEPVEEMTRTDHRLGENYTKNHPNANESSKIDRTKFRSARRKYWQKKLEQDHSNE